MSDDPKRGWDRRGVLTGALIGAGTLMVAAGDRLSRAPWFSDLLDRTGELNRDAFRLLTPDMALAREFPESAISETFKSNGTQFPQTREYLSLLSSGFVNWRLQVGGLVDTPLELSLSDLRAMPARTQITRHDCVEGWSCIGKWTGVPLAAVLDRARPKANARFVMFHCADRLGGDYYYESIDLRDAYHPQTILAYGMNDAPLDVPYGAPLRVRIERQLGYKMAKYITGIELVESFADIRGGKGGYWEDRGYYWYAGI